jgi:hypothetical protein
MSVIDDQISHSRVHIKHNKLDNWQQQQKDVWCVFNDWYNNLMVNHDDSEKIRTQYNCKCQGNKTSNIKHESKYKKENCRTKT